MAWITEKTFTDLEVMAARYHNDFRDDMEYMKGIQASQEVIQLADDATLSVADAVISPETEDALTLKAICSVFTSGYFSFGAYIGGGPASGDAVDLRFGLYDATGPTTEDLARIRIKKSASTAGRGSISLSTASGGSFPGTDPVTIHHTRRITINNGSSSSYALDITGDLNATDYEGLTVWGENPAGTAYNNGDAQITNQWISTVATGTAPLRADSGADTCKNLNADLLSGVGWPGAPVSGTGTPTVTTPNTEYTAASCTAGGAGVYLVVGEVTVTIASGDEACKFLAQATGAPRWTEAAESTLTGAVQLASTSFYTATAGETLYLKIKKSAGTGSSTTTGSIKATLVTP